MRPNLLVVPGVLLLVACNTVATVTTDGVDSADQRISGYPFDGMEFRCVGQKNQPKPQFQWHQVTHGGALARLESLGGQTTLRLTPLGGGAGFTLTPSQRIGDARVFQVPSKPQWLACSKIMVRPPTMHCSIDVPTRGCTGLYAGQSTVEGQGFGSSTLHARFTACEDAKRRANLYSCTLKGPCDSGSLRCQYVASVAPAPNEYADLLPISATYNTVMELEDLPDGCSDECSAGEKRCTDGDGFEECADGNGDGCVEWSGRYSCSTSFPGTTCSAGWCVGPQPVSCADQCTEGSKQCLDGDAFNECHDWNGDGCTEWGGWWSCGTSFPGTSCSGGWCVGSPPPQPPPPPPSEEQPPHEEPPYWEEAPPSCDDCSPGSKQCLDGDVFTECQDWDGDGCAQWGGAWSCGYSFPGTTCRDGWCVGE